MVETTVSTTERGPRLDWLQVSRGMAALLVVSYHAFGRVDSMGMGGEVWFGQVFEFANSGVDLFFVISGFVIAYAHGKDIGRPQQLGRYAYRRLSRIYPPLWVLCACVLPLYFVMPSAGPEYARDWTHVLAQLALFPIPPKQILAISWTLVVEMGFYLMFALLIISRRIGVVLFGFWAGLVLFQALVQPFGSHYYVNSLLNRDYIDFFAGIGVAVLIRRLSLTGMKAALTAIAGVGVFLLAPVVLVGGVQPQDNPLSLEMAYTFGGVLIIAGVVWLDQKRVAAPRVLVALGNATYSIYLFHWVVGWVVEVGSSRLGPLLDLPANIIFAGIVIGMTAFGYGAYLVIERPLLKLAGRLWDRRTKPTL